jgi:hypothetical protein
MSVLIEHLPPRRIDIGLDGGDRFRDSTGLNLCGLEWTLKNAEAAQAGIQGFDIDLPESPSVRLIRTGSPGAWTKITIEFTREFSRMITYDVQMKFAGTQPPGQVQEFHHTIR